MDKRNFLKITGAFIAGGVLSRALPGGQSSDGRSNWAGNYRYSAGRLDDPQSVEEIQAIVKARSQVKPLGTRHSFNTIADTTGDQVSLKNFRQMTLDPKSRTVTIGAGVTYGQLAPYLYDNGYALHNLASLPHISVAGGCATATHGSGVKNGNLSTEVAAMEIVTGAGDVKVLSRERDAETFPGAVVGLGGLGIFSKLTLHVQPKFDVRQTVYENLSFSELEHHLDEIFASGYSVSLFTDWQGHRATQVWIKSRVDQPGSPALKPEFYGAAPAKQKLHPLAGHSAENCTEQMGIPGPWYERLPHFRMNFTPSSGNELQSEYFVPRERGYEAILAVEQLRDRITPHLLISELRTIDADDFWMSPCYRRASMTIHFTWKPEWPEVKNVLPLIEEKLAPFDARPHWAKLFTMAPARLQSLYPKLPEFRGLVKEYDPSGKFRNRFLADNVYSHAGA